MKKIFLTLMLMVPISAFADHIDVIEVQLKDGCTFAQYLAIKDDFNAKWGSKNGYRSEVFMPIQSQNLVSFYWVGRSASAAAFGKAWDQWRTDLQDANTIAAKLWARFEACSTNMSRRGYDVY